MSMRRRTHGCHEQTRLPLVSTSKEHSVSESGRRSNTACTNVGIIIIITSLLVFGVMILMKLCSTEPPVQLQLLGSQQKSRLLQHHEGALYRPREYQLINYVDIIHLHSSRRQFDVIIVGCGPAGITAAMFAARMGMSVLVVGSPSAGSLSGTDRIDNYPSFFGTTNDGGQGWIDASLEQAAYFGAEFAHPTYLATNLVKTTSEEHTAIEVHLRSESITTSSPESKVIGKAAIIATGSIPRKLNLAHESSLWGHALHNCALCDGDNYVTRGGAKKHVAVIGGGDAAVEAMFLLHNIGVDTIHWIHRRESYRATSSDVEKIRQLTNVEIWAPYVVVEWILKRWENIAKEGNFAPLALGGIRVVAAKNGQSDLEATSSITIPCDGAFLMIGSSPNTHWLESSGIDIDSTSKLIRQSSVSDGSRRDIINDMTSRPVFSTATSMEGVFAAGEVVDDIYRQALTASSEGAKAAIDVQRYLRMKGFDDTSSKRNNLAIEDRNKGSERASALVKRNKVDCDLTASECIKFVVSAYPVVVFSKAYCPFCRRALEVLRSYSDRGNFIEPLVLDLTEIEDPSAKATGKRTIQDTLEVMTGRRTVPNVFVGGVSIGGGDETTALHMAGKLDGILRTAGAFD